MKNYKEMADAVFARRDEYVAGVKRKKKIALSTGLSLCAICLATLGAIGIWKTGVVEPDPGVIGTRPHYFTESTEQSVNHTLSSPATSEGVHGSTAETSTPTSQQSSENTGNTNVNGTKPTQNTTSNGDKPPKVTDPAEKPTKVTDPLEKPTDAPSATDKPQTSTGSVVTDPVETPITTDGYVDATSATEPDYPTQDGVPDEPTDSPATRPSHDLPVTNGDPEYTAPCMTEPIETQVPVATEAPTVSPTEPTAAPCVEGSVTDQNGNPVKGAIVMVYNDGEAIGSAVTNRYGYYYISGFDASKENYVTISSLPNGYTNTNSAQNFTGRYNYIILTCSKD